MTPTKKSASLASLAMLKVNWDHLGKDYLDSLAPFVVEATKLAPSDVVSLSETQQRVEVQFGLAIPQNVLRSLFRRLHKSGMLSSVDGVYRRTPAIFTDRAFETSRDQVVQSCESVVSDLAAFAAERHRQDWTVQESESALLAFLAKNTMEMLFASVDHVPFTPPRSSQKAEYIVGDFVATTQHNAPQTFRGIETLLRGVLLTNALFLPDIGKVGQRFNKTRVFFDAPLLVFAAGAAGAARQAPVLELISLLHDNGATVCYFEHTLDEARGTLDACAHRIRNNLLRNAYGPSMEYFLETGMSDSDIELLSARLPHKLSVVGMTMQERPPYEAEFQVDEIGFERALNQAIHYYNPKALRRDVDSISAIARARRGHDSTDIERSRSVFVTPNNLLAKTTRDFFQPDAPPGAVALAVTDHALASILWLKNPTKAPDLPTKRLIADAYAALQPSDAIWKLYLAEISRLQEKGVTSADEYYVLRHAQVAKRTLMDLTQGEQEAFSAGTVDEILAIAKDSITSEFRVSLAKETERASGLEQQVMQLQEHNASVEARVASIAVSVGRIVEWTVFIGLGALLVVGIFVTFPWTLPEFSVARARYMLVAGQVALLAYTLVSTFVSSGPLRVLALALARRAETTTKTLLRKRFLSPPREPGT